MNIKKIKRIICSTLALILLGTCTLLFGKCLYVQAKSVSFKDENFKNILLKVLESSNNEISEEDMDRILSLDVEDENVWSLEGAQYLHNISTVFLENTNVADLSPLSNLNDITFMEITDSCVTDLSPIKNLKNINSLKLDNMNIDDLSPIENYENLESLYIENCSIKDISMLKNLKNLKLLYLANNNIENIESIGELKKLRIIELYGNYIKDISPLLNLPSEDEYEGSNDDKEVEKFIDLQDNCVDLNSSSKAIKSLENKGFHVYCDYEKGDIYAMSVNGKKILDTPSFINKNRDVNIEFNKDIEDKKGKLHVYSYDSYNNSVDLNYNIKGNTLSVNVKDLFDKVENVNISIDEEFNNLTNISLKDDSSIKGDINNDGKIDLEDLSSICKDYNKNSKDADTWNIKEDVVKDGIIDIYDLSKLSSEMDN